MYEMFVICKKTANSAYVLLDCIKVISSEFALVETGHSNVSRITYIMILLLVLCWFRHFILHRYLRDVVVITSVEE